MRLNEPLRFGLVRPVRFIQESTQKEIAAQPYFDNALEKHLTEKLGMGGYDFFMFNHAEPGPAHGFYVVTNGPQDTDKDDIKNAYLSITRERLGMALSWIKSADRIIQKAGSSDPDLKALCRQLIEKVFPKAEPIKVELPKLDPYWQRMLNKFTP